MQEIKQRKVTEMEQRPSPSLSGPDVVVGGMTELHASLDDMADSFDVSGFKCVKCGLVHMHDTMKHRLSSTFDVSDEDVASMEFNSVCHCGVQQAARNGSEYGIDESQAASIAENAPIPPEASRRMNEQFGGL